MESYGNVSNNEIANEMNEEKSLTLGEILFVVRKNILLILIITFVCTLAGSIYGLGFKEHSYTASTTTLVMVDVNKTGTQTTTEYTNYMYSIQLINTVEDFITSNLVIDRAIENLKNDYPELTYKSVKNNLSVSNGNNSLVVKISYTAKGDGKDQEAVKVVNELVDSMIYLVNNTTNDNGKLTYEILSNSISVMDKAKNSEAKRGAATIIAICFAVGLALSFGIILIKYLMDDTYKDKEEFERYYKINVIATIPNLVDTKGGEKE
ncbi:MAG: hypothetical protein IJS58_09075 [Bacilli bacterium]|nr:hypothetical protein [Bacilli bacterium]